MPDRRHQKTSTTTLPLFSHVQALAKDGAPHGRVIPAPKPAPYLVSTGLASVDGMLAGGVRSGLVTVVAARPKVGATSFMLGCVLAALRAGHRVLFATERLTEAQLKGRLVLLEARVNGHRIKAGLVLPEDRMALAAAKERIGWQSLRLHVQKPLRLQEIEAEVLTYRPTLICVDGLPRATQPNDCSLAFVGQALSRLAQSTGLALLLHATLPRDPDSDHAPTLETLGDLGTTCDTALVLHRPEVTLSQAYTEGSAGGSGTAECSLVSLAGLAIAPETTMLRFDQRFAGLVEL